jgi:hypothetical protein
MTPTPRPRFVLTGMEMRYTVVFTRCIIMSSPSSHKIQISWDFSDYRWWFR